MGDFVRFKGFLVLVLIYWVTQTALAGDCVKTGSVCSDTTPSKLFSGITVTLAQVGGCWEYTDTYQCIKPNSINYCAGLENTPGCFQTSTSPTVVAFNGTTMQETNTFQCGDPSLAAPTNTVTLPDSYTITKDALDGSQCVDYTSNPLCEITSHVCTEGPATRVINGLPVYKDCWKWEDTYACVSKSTQTDCTALIQAGCTLSGTTCLSELTDGSCSVAEKSYKCQTTAPKSETVMDCGTQQFCVNGRCDPAGSPPDNDFAKNAALMEIMRQAGNYMEASTLFNGKDERCTKGYFGLKNCCKESGNAQNNQQIMGSAVAQSVVSAAGSTFTYASYKASPYVYDFMYKGGFTNKAVVGMQAFAQRYGGLLCYNCNTEWLSAGGTGLGLVGELNFSSNIMSMYGATLTYGAAGTAGMNAVAVGGSATGAASSLGFSADVASNLGSTVTNLIDQYNFATQTFELGGGFAVQFNPYALAASLAFQALMEVLNCTSDEGLLGMHRGANLCHGLGSYCSNEIKFGFGKICLETTQSYCCYNSRLAKILNVQGRPQIGKGWGSAESPSCGGFTVDEFKGVDLAAMDLTEFINEIMANVKLPSQDQLKANTEIRVNAAVKNFYSN